MNNEQFRKLMLANSAKQSGDSKNADSPPAAGAKPGMSLGSRQRTSIPMTPRSVGNAQADFARQMADRNSAAAQTSKKYKTSAPKGVRLAEGYTDRAREREAADEREERLKGLEDSLKKEEIDQETYDKLRYEIAGGDLSSTHLVKGLDFKLLERVRKGEDVYSGKSEEAQEVESAEEANQADVDDEFDQLAQQEVHAVEKEQAAKKKGQLSTVSLHAGKKRTRDQILADLKASRQAAKEKAEADAALGNRFKKIGAKQTPGSRIERDSKGREVLIIVDEDGHEKRKVRKIQQGSTAEDATDNGLLMPDKDAKPLGMDVPEKYRQTAPAEDEEEDDDIFAGAGDDYDPLAGMDDSGSDSGSDGEDPQGNGEKPKLPDSNSMPPPPKPSAARNYFKDAKTGLMSDETTQSPSMSDPAIMAAIKRAAALRPLDKGEDDDEEDDEKTREERAKARAAEERRKKMLQNVDRDAEDLDMGFGTSRYEDEADFDDSDVKLSSWGGGDDDDEDGGGGAKGKKKRVRTKKRKGDGDNAADVLRVMEERRK